MKAPFTLGGLMAAKLPRLAAPAKTAKAPAARRVGAPGTLRLNRLPLSKVRTGGGY
jgi:hypothetical protein